MFTKKAPNESFRDWCKKNWKDIALLGLGLIVGTQILIGLYYGIAFLFFILKRSIGYAAVAGGGMHLFSHINVAALVGLGAIGTGLAVLATSLFKKIYHALKPTSPPMQTEKENVVLGSTHAQVNEKLYTLSPQHHSNPNNELQDNFSTNRISSSEHENFFSKTKRFFQNLPLLFSKQTTSHSSAVSSNLSAANEHSIRPK